MALVVYGLLGCSGCILFFNLFLERIITVLALLLRHVYECRRRRQEQRSRDGDSDVEPPGAGGRKSRRGSRYSGDDDDDLTDWKPSVYWVMSVWVMCVYWVTYWVMSVQVMSVYWVMYWVMSVYWVTSVYWVMLILFLAASVIACCAAALFHVQENWSYLDSLYYCFVSFSTIGFGDLVASQDNYYPYVYLHLPD